MNTEDLKNLVLMGIAGGVFLAGSQVQAAKYSNTSSPAVNGSTLAGCGSKSNGMRPYRSYDRSRESVKDRHRDNRHGDYRYEDGEDESHEENGYNGNGYDGAHNSSSGEIKESTLTSQLSPDSLRVYYSMNPEGKQLALKFSKQFSNKEEAVRQAHRIVNTPKGR